MMDLEKNKKLVLLQVLTWGVMFSVGENSFSIFANHIHAPLWFYGALVWIPNFFGPFTQVIAANTLEKLKKRIFLIYMPVLIQAACFLPIAFIAFWQKDPALSNNSNELNFTYTLLLISLFLYYLSLHFCTPSWQSFVGDLVSENERGRFFGSLSRASNIVMLTGIIAVWLALYFIETKLENNFNILSYFFAGSFILAFLARTTGGLIIKKMEEPPYHVKENSAFTFFQFIKRAPESNFVKFVLFAALLHCGANIAGPYFIDYWTGALHFSKAQWLVLQISGIIATLVTILSWGRFSDIFGNKTTLKYCSILIALTPIGWLFIYNFYGLLLYQFLTLIFWTGFNLSTINYIYEAASQTKRARCFAYYSIITGIGIFVGTQIGLFIANHFSSDFFGFPLKSSFGYVLIFSALVRLLACGAFLSKFKELRDIQPLNLRVLWNDVLEFNVLFQYKIKKKDTSNK